MHKKALFKILAFSLFLTVFWNEPVLATKNKIRVLCSFLPLQVFAANVINGRPGIELGVLIPGESGPHDYQLTPGDMRKIASADLFLAVGLALESFLEGPIHNANPGIKVVETGRIKHLIRYAKMDSAALPGGRHVTGGSHKKAHRHAMTFNPHTWVSPLAAVEIVRNIQKALNDLDPEGATQYRVNADGYVRKLISLHKKIARKVKTFPNRKIVTFHDAFDYFSRDHGLQVVAVLEEVAGQKPSAKEMHKIVEVIKSTGAAGVFAEHQFSPALARAISQEAGVPMGCLDPVATGLFSPDLYESVMKKNLEELNRFLGRKK